MIKYIGKEQINMAKKNHLISLRASKIHKNKHVRKHAPIGFVLLAVFIGFWIGKSQPVPTHPKTLVWAASNDVSVPVELISFLEKTPSCIDTDGKPKADGVNLWSVVKVSQNKYAKLAYGCSYDLNFYKVAVKQAGGWQILDNSTYLANNFLPYCEAIEAYKIDKTIEPFCLDAAGLSKENNVLPE